MRRADIVVRLLAAVTGVFSCVAANGDPAADLANAQPITAELSPGDATNLTSEITVEAQRAAVEHRINTYVQGITRSTQLYDASLARWRTPLCFAVAGLTSNQAAYVLKRLPEIAASVGAPVGHRGCAYNFFVVFSPEPNRLLKVVHDHRRGIFDGIASPAQVRRFMSPSKPMPVRVWYNGVVYNKAGIAIGVKNTGGMGADAKGFGIPTDNEYSASRLRLDDVVGLSMVFAVIDTTLMDGAKLGQLTDYVAMAGLAEMNLEYNVGDAPTILRIFATSAENRPPGLTAWDQAFLHALYHTDQTSTVQRSQISVSVVNEVTSPTAH